MNPATPTGRWLLSAKNWRHQAGGAFVVLLLLGILYYYFWLAFLGYPTSVVPSKHMYSKLADSFLAGKMHFLDDPSPQLLALKDPYDPDQNKEFRTYHDASLYKGKWYLYFGITPVLLLGIPLRLMGYTMLDDVAAPIFCWVGLLASLLFLRTIVHAGKLKPKYWMWIAAILCLALSSTQPALMVRSQIYEVAIASAYCCTMLALYFLASGFMLGRIINWRLALGSLFLAMAVGARPHFVLFGWILAAVGVWLWRNGNQESKNNKWLTFACLCFPYAAFGFLLALYNYLRFGSPAEFGMTYSLCGLHIKEHKMWDYHSFLPNLYFYICQPLQFDWYFPFIHNRKPMYPGDLPTYHLGALPIAGMMYMAPFLSILALAVRPFGALGGLRSKNPGTTVSSALIFMGLTIMIFLCAMMPSAVMRYQMDFAPYLVLAAILFWFQIHQQAMDAMYMNARRFINIFMAAAVFCSCVVGLAIGMSGEADFFKIYNPLGYAKLARDFSFVRRLGGRPTQKITINARFNPSYPEFSPHISAFANGTVFSYKPQGGNFSEPLMTSGTAESADYLFVTYLTKNRIHLGWSAYALDNFAGVPTEIDFSTPHKVTLELDGSITILIDGKMVFSLSGLPLVKPIEQLDQTHCYFGKNPFGGMITTPKFSGEILEVNVK